MQSRGSGVKRGANNQFPEAAKTIKGYDLYLGSLLFLNKKAPSPRFRSNLFMQYDIYSGKLIIPEYLQTVITKLDDLLKGKSDSDQIKVLEDESDDDIEV